MKIILKTKEASKIRLQTPMRELKDRFQQKTLLRAFLRKSFFNGTEVQYLTILRENLFYVYWCDDVVRALADKFEVTNSSARKKGEYDAQKVLFRIDDKNVGELEMRNSGKNHYGEVLFNMNRKPFLGFFDQQEKFITSEWSDEIMLCGQAIKTFGKWQKTGNAQSSI